MLQNIKLHLHADEDTQREIEARIAPSISRRQKENLNVFQRIMPNVYEKLVHGEQGTYSILCNKDSELNIVDYAEGRVIYGRHPRTEITQQVEQFLCWPQYIYLTGCNSTASKPAHRNILQGLNSALADSRGYGKEIPEEGGVVVVLGIGIGYHLLELLTARKINHLIIYEPEESLFRCSLLASQWRELFDLARRKNTALYLQLGKDGRDIHSDINELAKHVDIEGFYLYQHYHHPVFDQLVAVTAQQKWENIADWTPDFVQTKRVEAFTDIWKSPVNMLQWSTDNLDQQRFTNNLQAFKRYFPDIYKEFKEYSPTLWQPLANVDGEVNIFNHESLAPLYSNMPGSDGDAIFEHFSEYPNKNNLILGYEGKKLNRYQHYQFVSKITPLLADLEDSQGDLPESIRSMIVFGMGAGYQLLPLIEQHSIEKLFVCEPNRDYFYASLYAVDWAGILQTIDMSGARLYLNIGDDGSHLVEDLLVQFHSLGPYLLAETYFYQTLYNPRLKPAINKLYEQLRVIVAMGEYFDHALYGINHTRLAIERGIPFMRKNASSRLSAEDRDVPICLVGNGPSLDPLMPFLKEHADRAIIISCGTALQSLHRNGIKPDFHAEIESNRATYDWASRISDPEYLRGITLISCNGIHPDTCDLYQNTLLAFKGGESSTVSVSEMYDAFDFVLMEKAYPTVSNFAAEFVRNIGLKECYLFGVDLGFVDHKYHHSKNSGYYDDEGQELYDYSSLHNMTNQVPGNLRTSVYTKYEFRVSASVLGEIFSTVTGTVYNLNDGAKIKGTIPLQPENVLMVTSPEMKSRTVKRIKDDCFVSFDQQGFSKRYSERFCHESLVEELDGLISAVETVPSCRKVADNLISEQREILIASYKRHKSTLFFLLNGSLNHFNSVLSKLLSLACDEQFEAALKTLVTEWRDFLIRARQGIDCYPDALDFISSNPVERKQALMSRLVSENTLGQVDIAPVSKMPLLKMILQRFEKNDSGRKLDKSPHYAVVFFDPATHASQTQGGKRCYIATEQSHVRALMHQACPVVFMPGSIRSGSAPQNCHDIFRVRIAIEALMNDYASAFLLPKLIIDDEHQCVTDYYDLSFWGSYHAYDAHEYILLTHTKLTNSDLLTTLHDRLRPLLALSESDFIKVKMPLTRQNENKQKLITKVRENALYDIVQ